MIIIYTVALENNKIFVNHKVSISLKLKHLSALCGKVLILSIIENVDSSLDHLIDVSLRSWLRSRMTAPPKFGGKKNHGTHR